MNPKILLLLGWCIFSFFFLEAQSCDPISNNFTLGGAEHDPGFQNVSRVQPAAKLSNGSFVVSWETRDGIDGDEGGIFFQLLNNDGTSVGDVIRPYADQNDAGIGYQDNAIVTALNSGFIIAWNSEDGPGDSGPTGASGLDRRDIFFRVYNENGTPKALTRIDNQESEDNLAYILPLQDGGFVLLASIGEDFDGDNSDDYFIYIYREEGNLIGPINISGGIHDDLFQTVERNIPMVDLGNGKFAVSWEARDIRVPQNQPSDGYLRIFDTQGNAVTEVIRPYSDINPSGTGKQAVFGGQLIALENGNLVMAWVSEDGPGDEGPDGGKKDVFFRVYDPNGNAVSGSTRANSDNISNADELGGIIPLTNGNFAVLYFFRENGPGPTNDYFVRTFNSSGTPIGTSLEISNGQHTNVFSTVAGTNPSFIPLNNGNFAVGWAARNGADGDESGVYYRVFNAMGAAVSPVTLAYGDINPNGTGNQSAFGPLMEALPNGFAIAWDSEDGPEDNDKDVYHRVIDNDGNPICGTLKTNTDNDSQGNRLRFIQPLSNGDFAVIYDVQQSSPARNDLFVRVLGGTPVELEVSDLNNIEQSNDAGRCEALIELPTPTITNGSDEINIITSVGNGPGTSFDFPVGPTEVVYTITDEKTEQTVTATLKVTVNDTELPTIICPGSIEKDVAPGETSATVTFDNPTFNDNCPNPELEQTEGLASGANFPLGTTTNVFKVSDASGNVATCQFEIELREQAELIITGLSNIQRDNDPGICGASVELPTPTVANGIGNISITTSVGDGPGTSFDFPFSFTEVVYTITDDATGQTVTESITVEVWDTEPPTIICPDNIEVSADPGSNSAKVEYVIDISDNCDNDNDISVNFVDGGLPSGSNFPIGTTPYFITATDVSGNERPCSFTITVLESNICPTIETVNLNPNTACVGDILNFSATYSNLAAINNNDKDYGLQILLADKQDANPYTDELSLINTIPLEDLDAGGFVTTLSSLSVNAGSFFIYTILSESPEDENCRPFIVTPIEISALPVVSFTSPGDFFENEGIQIGLSGGLPEGGVYSGPGVMDDGNGQTYSFDPAAAGIGMKTIVYTLTTPEGCEGTASDEVEVMEKQLEVSRIADINASDPNSGNPLLIGEEVALQGIVHCQDFVPGTGYQFWILEPNGDGIIVSSPQDLESYIAVEGDEIIVEGVLASQKSGTLENRTLIIEASKIELVSQGNNLVSPMVVNTLDESLENKLVTLEIDVDKLGEITSASLTNGDFFYVFPVDGVDVEVYISQGTDISSSFMAGYSELEDISKYVITGFVTQFFRFYRIWPCSRSDLDYVIDTDNDPSWGMSLITWPNPVTNRIFLNSSVPMEIVRIIDIRGNVVSEAMPNSAIFSIDVSLLFEGIYNVQVINGNNVVNRQIIKQN